MKNKTKNLNMLNPMRSVAIIFALAFTFLMIQSCSNDEISSSEIESINSETRSVNSEECYGKQVLIFNSLSALQQEHYALYELYMNGNEDEQILVDYENDNNFYSLRKKENDMDDGTIPYDPDFDETEYTFDPVFETLLNQDGMIVIDNRLYIWSSGCVIHSIPFSCDNYVTLSSFREAALNNDAALMYQLFHDFKITNTDVCNDIQYDLEYVSENGGSVDAKDIPFETKNNCGYEVILNKELVSCENNRYIFKISFENIAPIGASIPLNLYYLNGIFGDLEQLEYGFDLFGPFNPIPIDINQTNYGYLIPTVGEIPFYISAPQTMGMQVGILLKSTINPLTGNSCTAIDDLNIDMTCPFGLTATKIDVTNDISTWLFEFPVGDAACNINVTNITWDFGDGTSQVSGSALSVHHEFIQPCFKDVFTVTALVTGDICGQNLEDVAYTIDIPVGDACKRPSYKFPTIKQNVNGKRLKMAAKIKRNIFGKTVFKQVFKWRIAGDKTIECSGNVYSPTPNNSGPCIETDITTLVPTKTTNGKKRNRQKVKISSINQINALNPYEVKFSHSDGFSYTLIATDLYCSE